MLFKSAAIMDAECHIANLKKQIAGTTDANAKKWYRTQLQQWQENLKMLKKG